MNYTFPLLKSKFITISYLDFKKKEDQNKQESNNKKKARFFNQKYFFNDIKILLKNRVFFVYSKTS